MGTKFEQRSGTTFIEYTVFLSLIFGTVLFTLEFLGFTANGAFDRIAHRIENEENTYKDFQANSHSIDQTFASSGIPLTVREWALAHTSEFRMANLILSLSLMTLGWYWLYSKRKMRIRQEEYEQSQLRASQKREAGQEHQLLFEKRQHLLKILNQDVHLVLENNLLVSHLMTKKILTVDSRASRKEVEKTMDENGVRHLIVIDSQDRICGIISNRDFVKLNANSARELMTTKLMVVESQTPINQAVTLLLQKSVSALPVVNKGRLCGIITSTDLMLILQCVTLLLQRLHAQKNLLENIDEEAIEKSLANLSQTLGEELATEAEPAATAH
ncbi:MAG: CBS domain-containing protein [Pirellulaceae bacterium]|nr:CBS domain-containing protein [Pirellulaceae bacterium]